MGLDCMDLVLCWKSKRHKPELSYQNLYVKDVISLHFMLSEILQNSLSLLLSNFPDFIQNAEATEANDIFVKSNILLSGQNQNENN